MPDVDHRLNADQGSTQWQPRESNCQEDPQPQDNPWLAYKPRARNIVGPGPGTDAWIGFDPSRVGEDPQQGGLGPRANWKAPRPEGTSHGKEKRTLQLLIDDKCAYAGYYVMVLKISVYQALTSNWHLIQGAALGGEKSKIYLRNLFNLLELDWHSQWCLVGLHASGLPGACHFAQVMWGLLKTQACKEPYEDLSAWVTNLVKLTRRRFDQPPADHNDMHNWGWSKMEVPHKWCWCPLAIPQEVLKEDPNYSIVVAPDGEPLKPPMCWPHKLRVPAWVPRRDNWCQGPRKHDMRQGPHPRQDEFDSWSKRGTNDNASSKNLSESDEEDLDERSRDSRGGHFHSCAGSSHDK